MLVGKGGLREPLSLILAVVLESRDLMVVVLISASYNLPSAVVRIIVSKAPEKSRRVTEYVQLPSKARSHSDLV